MYHSQSTRHVHSALVALLCLLSWSQEAQGGYLQVSPVRLTLSATQPVDTLTVRNDGPDSTVVQAQPYTWSQEAGEDRYTPSAELLVSPPIFTLPVGGSQIVRVGLRRAVLLQHELSYRLYLQEVPSPLKADGLGLQVTLRLGVPVFFSPPAPASPALSWRASRRLPTTIQVDLNNGGNTHVQLTSLQLLSAQNEHLLVTQKLSTYVLPGQTHSWLINTSASAPLGARLRLLAQTDVGEVYEELDLAAP